MGSKVRLGSRRGHGARAAQSRRICCVCRSAERYTAENNATKWDELQCFDAVGWAAGRASAVPD